MGRRVVVMIGQPGAGKGTQARAIMQQLSIPQISTGDILRDAISRKTQLGMEAKAKMDAGDLVEDRIVNEIVAQRIERDDCAGGFILDGYPRTVQQAKVFQQTLGVDDQFFVIELAVDSGKLIDRLVRRCICRSCGEIYNLDSRVPQQQDVCDRCGGALMHRTDDRAETIAERLRTFEAETFPLIEFYRSYGVYHQVNGMRPIEQVTGEILAILESALTKRR